MSYRLTQAAREDIDRLLYEGMTRFGIRQAEAYYHELLGRFDFLAENPRAAPERRDVNPPVRTHPFKAHVIVYQVMPDDILILAIRNTRENWYDLSWLS